MTLTLTPQELRDLLDGASPSITTRIVAPANPPDGGHISVWPDDPPVDMTPRTPCAPRRGRTDMAGLTWFKFAAAMRGQACRLTDSDCQMVFVMPDGQVVTPKSMSVELIPPPVDSFGDFTYKVKLEDKE